MGKERTVTENMPSFLFYRITLKTPLLLQKQTPEQKVKDVLFLYFKDD